MTREEKTRKLAAERLERVNQYMGWTKLDLAKMCVLFEDNVRGRPQKYFIKAFKAKRRTA